MSKNQQLLAKIEGSIFVLMLSFTVGQQSHAATVVSNLGETTVTQDTASFSIWLAIAPIG